ncbi:TPR domain containing protein [Lysobacter dokdonensis DS-58]|uniref:TPR domain containing protein n=1 Tax=Lysobacter dokdonensis DS-58 TaxID=1300345 RepID=A0A0A2WIX9_9GAMM|nr:sulfotransferase [Lysobacter dokdonensis]KGQ19758.1 TPR domain containing protein [Lysobacter dokdonensis DS-58]
MQPQSLQAWQTAERLLNAQQLPQARAAYTALTNAPDVAALAHLRLSLIAGREGRLREATHHAVAAWEARQPEADVLGMIAKRLFSLGELELAAGIATYDAVLTAGDPGLHFELGKQMSVAMLPGHALPLLERARELGLDTGQVRYLIGLSKMHTGDIDGAQRELESARIAAPDFPQAAWSLAKLRTWTDADNHVEQLRADVARIGEDRPESALFHYALAKELDDLGRADEAWPVLDTAMRLRRASAQYDAGDAQQLFAHLGALEGGVSDLVKRDDDATPIFIVGMPRSGTTLLERILGAHSQVADAGELLDFTRQLRWMADRQGPAQLDLALARQATDIDFAELGRRYLDHTRWRTQGKPYFTDKMPENFLNVGYIARALPHAKFLHVMRDPMDTCFSNLKEHFASFYGHTYDQVELANYYKGYRQLMAHWRRLYPDRILDVRYGELTIDTKRVTGDILEFLGLPWEDAVLSPEKRTGSVATASTTQVREAIHQHGKNKWRKYEAQLAPLKTALGSYGYSARD